MSVPKISGLLHNCALNSALPTLLDGIHAIAERERLGKLDAIAHNTVYQNYQRLKDLFAKSYGVDGHPNFNWQAFSSFVRKHSFYANEIIFAPVLRNFIAEIGLAHEYPLNGIGALRDVTERGRYNMLHYLEAVDLLHNPFGISVAAYEYIGNKGTNHPEDNYKHLTTKVTTNKVYPFGKTPMLLLYFKGAHFEIQPHELSAAANREYVKQINQLPLELAAVHEGLTVSQQAFKSNEMLGQLFVYAHLALKAQLGAVSTKEPPPPPHQVIEKKDKTEVCDFVLRVEEYRKAGTALHSDTLAGRQTFAVILLCMMVEDANLKQQAQLLLSHMENLAFLAKGDEPLATYYLDSLATAIIESGTQLSAKKIEQIIYQMDQSRQAQYEMSAIQELTDNEKHKKLILSAMKTIHYAWQSYQKSHDEGLIEIIQKTQAIAAAPTPENIASYHELYGRMNGKRSVGKIISGLLFCVLSAALAVVATLGFVGTFGLSTPLSAAALGLSLSSFAVGCGFFKASQASVLNRSVLQIREEASKAHKSSKEMTP